MCKVGDIIVIKNYRSQGTEIGRHSFVVLSTDKGKIQGLDFDLVCNVMSSFHSEEHRRNKLRYKGNLEYSADKELLPYGHGRDGYIKADQFYYFDRNRIDFYVLGKVSPELFNELLEFINRQETVEHIIDNV